MRKNEFNVEGNLTRDPELRFTQNGNGVCSFGLALDNEDNKAVAFVTAVAWGADAEDIANDAKKGTHFKGVVRLNTRTYENRDGQNVWVTELVLCGEYSLDKPRATNANTRTTNNRTNGNSGRSPRQGAQR